MRVSTARLLLAGDGFSAFGSWIDYLAILTLSAYHYRASPFNMAIVSAAGLLPGILASRHVGRLCDRGNPKNLLQLSIALRVAITAVILFTGNFALFLACVGLRSVFSNVAIPAINVLAVRTVAGQDRPRFYAALNILHPPVSTPRSCWWRGSSSDWDAYTARWPFLFYSPSWVRWRRSTRSV